MSEKRLSCSSFNNIERVKTELINFLAVSSAIQNTKERPDWIKHRQTRYTDCALLPFYK